MKIEIRYAVLKLKDVRKYLTDEEVAQLWKLCAQVQAGRSLDDKGPLSCICIEEDWPEYEPTLKILSDRVDSQEVCPSCEGLGGHPIDPPVKCGKCDGSGKISKR